MTDDLGRCLTQREVDSIAAELIAALAEAEERATSAEAERDQLRRGIARRMDSLSDGEPVKWDLRAILDGSAGDKVAQDLDDILDALEKAEAERDQLKAVVERVEALIAEAEAEDYASVLLDDLRAALDGTTP